MANRDLRIAVVGAGMMGGDHIARITQRISGAIVAAIVEPDPVRADAAAASAPGPLSVPTSGTRSTATISTPS